ncbi:MAG TPA: hypothetical protein VGA37_09885 [Gemmatimonadales bacterium]
MPDPLGPLAELVFARREQCARDRIVDRIARRDPTVWAADPAAPEVADRLGWLALGDTMRPAVDGIVAFAEDARAAFDHVVLCGMGGSSLAPEVLWRTFGRRAGFPALHLLDSTHPAAVGAAPDGPRALYVIASKSGGTIETASFFRHFWQRTGGNGAQFVAITDPGSPLALDATAKRFRRVFLNPPDVGGRYSALSLFGLVPAALIGIDVHKLLARARVMASDPASALALGVTLGEAARHGRYVLSLSLSAGIASLGLWLEQLVAESTGKNGVGMLPATGAGTSAGSHVLHATVVLCGETATEAPPDAPPTITLELTDRFDIAAAFYRWEYATAVAGHVLGVNPFDQPNVAESKSRTDAVLAQPGPPVAELTRTALDAWLGAIDIDDYVAVTAFVPPDPSTDDRLDRLARDLHSRTGATVTTAYGPRYLHSTGQFHKGGPPRGHFLQLRDRPARDLPIPGTAYGFADLLMAQAEGDRQALIARRRPVIAATDWDLVYRGIAG